MGQKISKSYAGADNSLQQYTIITSDSVLEFDHKKGVALCVGIDKQFHPKYADKSLGNIVAKNAKSMGEALVINLGLNRDRTQVCISSDQLSKCTKKGLGSTFVKSAKNVEENGIFIFYFAGHGYLVKERCVLAPADFAEKEDDFGSGISGDDLVEWLHMAECKANHVLFIFDCCFAGDLGTTLTSPEKMMKFKPGLFVMCGCAARERCVSVNTLGHSIFTYFILHYLERHQCNGRFSIKQAMEDINEMCSSFSSLLVSYNHDKGTLQYSEMNPTFHTLDIHESDIMMDETDSGRSELVKLLNNLFKHGQPRLRPHLNVHKWLKSPSVQGSLQTLHKKCFTESLQEGIFCTMLYSVASIQYEYDKNSLEERNLFNVMAINVLAAMSITCPDDSMTIFHLITGLEHYSQPVLVGRLNRTFLNDLLSEMLKVADKSCNDEVDAPAVQPKTLSKKPTQL